MFLTAIMFLGGAWAGLLYVGGLSDGFIASSVGFLLAPLAFIASLTLFEGANVLTRAGRALRKRSLAAGDAVSAGKGSIVAVPICTVLGMLGGALVGVTSETLTPISAAIRLGAIGLVYGLILWQLLRTNLIAFPE